MRNLLTVTCLGLLAWGLLSPSTDAPKAKPAPVVKPAPCPGPDCPAPKPTKPKPKPWGEGAGPGQGQPYAGEFKVAGHVSPKGTEAAIDFPPELWMRNIGGSDGAGMCVNSSLEMAFAWLNRDEMKGYRNWTALAPGGGWPSRTDQQLAAWAKYKGIPPVQYLQYQGADLGVVELALKTGRMIGVTYGGNDGVLYKSSISHMVCAVHAAGDEYAIMDNNPHGDPAENYSLKYLWMSKADFAKRWMQGKAGWAIIPLYAPPPPVPSAEGLSPATPLLTTFQPHGFSVAQQTPVANLYTGGVAVEGGYTWSVGDGGFWLYQGPKKVGAWFNKSKNYHPLKADGSFGEKATPPVTPPTVTAPTGVVNPGIGAAECFTLNGFGIAKDDALRLLAEKKIVHVKDEAPDQTDLPDDAGKLRLTVIGTGADRAPVLADLESDPALAPFRGKVSLWACAADHWSVKDCGFVALGNPTIYLQHGGKVLHRQDTYDGPSKLAVAIAGALRKADPSYDPSHDPDLTRPTLSVPALGALLSGVTPERWLLAGSGVVGLVCLYLTRKGVPPLNPLALLDGRVAAVVQAELRKGGLK